jgi:hypothetical protein
MSTLRVHFGASEWKKMDLPFGLWIMMGIPTLIEVVLVGANLQRADEFDALVSKVSKGSDGHYGHKPIMAV